MESEMDLNDALKAPVSLPMSASEQMHKQVTKCNNPPGYFIDLHVLLVF